MSAFAVVLIRGKVAGTVAVAGDEHLEKWEIESSLSLTSNEAKQKHPTSGADPINTLQ